jgi:hypothetical protein
MCRWPASTAWTSEEAAKVARVNLAAGRKHTSVWIDAVEPSLVVWSLSSFVRLMPRSEYGCILERLPAIEIAAGHYLPDRPFKFWRAIVLFGSRLSAWRYSAAASV